MIEKYEAHAYIKLKEEGEKDEDKDVKDFKSFLSLLGQLLFQTALTDVYDEGMKSSYPNISFMLRLTDFFVTCTSSFYTVKNSEEETIKTISSFLDAVKQDCVESTKQAFKVKEEILK